MQTLVWAIAFAVAFVFAFVLGWRFVRNRKKNTPGK
jgi:membrane protein implicated in regulation of membrane protease activity